jgi:hypothetical protein
VKIARTGARRCGLGVHGGGAHVGPPHPQWPAVLSYWQLAAPQSVSFTQVSAAVWQKYAMLQWNEP